MRVLLDTPALLWWFTVAHRDPFDRMLAAQSELERLTLLTRDPAYTQFGTATVW